MYLDMYCIEGENVRIINNIPAEDLTNRARTNIPTDLRLRNTIVATLDKNHCIQLGGQKEEEKGPTKLSIGVLKPKLERKGRSSCEATIQSVQADMLGQSKIGGKWKNMEFSAQKTRSSKMNILP